MQSYKSREYYDKMLPLLLKNISEYCKNDKDIFYDHGKYFERALLNHGTIAIPKITCKNTHCRSRNEKYIDFEDYICNLLAYENENNPIRRLFYERVRLNKDKKIQTAASGDEIIVSYLCCVIAKYISIYSLKDNYYDDNGCQSDFQGKKYMEDLFLDAIYCITIHRDIINGLKEELNNENNKNRN